MKLLITGGTGLIGLSFIKQFSHYDFTVLTRCPSRARATLPPPVRLIASLNELNTLDEFDGVINLAGEPIIEKRWSNKQKNIINESRWEITKQLVDLFACSQCPPKVFLSGSAVGIYGNRGSELLTESSIVTGYDFPTELCIHWERLARQAEPYSRVALLRTGIVLSPHGGALKKILLPFKCYLGGRISDGQQYMPWIHIQDHINAIHHILTTDAIAGGVNLAAPNPETNQSFTHTLAKSLERFALLPVPKKALKVVLGESSCLLLDSQRVFPGVLINSGFAFEYPYLEAALQNILIENTAIT